jgi:hypothetical protein
MIALMKSYSVLRGSLKRPESKAMRRVCICPADQPIPIQPSTLRPASHPARSRTKINEQAQETWEQAVTRVLGKYDGWTLQPQPNCWTPSPTGSVAARLWGERYNVIVHGQFTPDRWTLLLTTELQELRTSFVQLATPAAGDRQPLRRPVDALLLLTGGAACQSPEQGLLV